MIASLYANKVISKQVILDNIKLNQWIFMCKNSYIPRRFLIDFKPYLQPYVGKLITNHYVVPEDIIEVFTLSAEQKNQLREDVKARATFAISTLDSQP